MWTNAIPSNELNQHFEMIKFNGSKHRLIIARQLKITPRLYSIRLNEYEMEKKERNTSCPLRVYYNLIEHKKIVWWCPYFEVFDSRVQKQWNPHTHKKLLRCFTALKWNTMRWWSARAVAVNKIIVFFFSKINRKIKVHSQIDWSESGYENNIDS